MYRDLFGGLGRGLACWDVQVHCWVHLSWTADAAIFSLRLYLCLCSQSGWWLSLLVFIVAVYAVDSLCPPWRCCMFNTSYTVVGVCLGPFISPPFVALPPFPAFCWIIFVFFLILWVHAIYPRAPAFDTFLLFFFNGYSKVYMSLTSFR